MTAMRRNFGHRFYNGSVLKADIAFDWRGEIFAGRAVFWLDVGFLPWTRKTAIRWRERDWRPTFSLERGAKSSVRLGTCCWLPKK